MFGIGSGEETDYFRGMRDDTSSGAEVVPSRIGFRLTVVEDTFSWQDVFYFLRSLIAALNLVGPMTCASGTIEHLVHWSSVIFWLIFNNGRHVWSSWLERGGFIDLKLMRLR